MTLSTQSPIDSAIESSESFVPNANPLRHYESHTVTMLKFAGRRLGEPVIKKGIESIIAGSITGQRAGRGWSASIVSRPVDPNDEYDMSRVDAYSADETFYNVSYVPADAKSGSLEYRVEIKLELNTERQRESIEAELLGIVTTMHARGQYPKWNVEKLDGADHKVKAPSQSSLDAAATSYVVGGAKQLSAADAVGYAPCVKPSNWITHFSHLYGLSDQIGMVESALDSALTTGWAKRFHTKLIGPPGCGKSAILSAMKRAVGEESVLEFDATATTAAGAMQMLEEFEELPRILIVEELEKAPTDTFQFLLGLMDDRSEVRKVTARKKIFRETKLLVFATINDESMLDRAMGGTEHTPGALSSRFSQPIYFNRPSRELLAKILEREIRTYGGDESWIEPTLDMTDALNITDPRRVIAMCMLGRSDLITGEFQRRMLAVGMPHKDGDVDTADSRLANLARLVKSIQG